MLSWAALSLLSPSTWWHLIVGKFGFELAVAGLLFAAWLFIPEVPWITSNVRKALLIAAIAVGTHALGYGSGFPDGYARSLKELAAQDRAAIAAYEAAGAPVDACAEIGGKWNKKDGKCDR
jgi:hypothetical protein